MGTATTPAASATLPGLAGRFETSVPIRARYHNWIGGEYVQPVRGLYFTNPTPITGQPLCEVARSTHEDVDKALDADFSHYENVSAILPCCQLKILISNSLQRRKSGTE